MEWLSCHHSGNFLTDQKLSPRLKGVLWFMNQGQIPLSSASSDICAIFIPSKWLTALFRKRLKSFRCPALALWGFTPSPSNAL
jgi:hypothetical protein